MEEFELIVPGSAKAIIDERKTEAAHRRKYEQRALSFQGLEQIGGRLLGFVFAIVALGVTVYLAQIGADWTASIVGAGTIGSVVLALISGRPNSLGTPRPYQINATNVPVRGASGNGAVLQELRQEGSGGHDQGESRPRETVGVDKVGIEQDRLLVKTILRWIVFWSAGCSDVSVMPTRFQAS